MALSFNELQYSRHIFQKLQFLLETVNTVLRSTVVTPILVYVLLRIHRLSNLHLTPVVQVQSLAGCET